MAESKMTYLQKAWGDSIDNVTIEDIKIAISEAQNMDEEHGAFWVGIGNTFCYDEENILETHKDLSVLGIFADQPYKEIKAIFKTWTDIENVYRHFLSGDFEKVKAMLIEKE